MLSMFNARLILEHELEELEASSHVRESGKCGVQLYQIPSNTIKTLTTKCFPPLSSSVISFSKQPLSTRKTLIPNTLCTLNAPLNLTGQNYYRYAPLTYDDLDILVPLPKTTFRDYRYKGIYVEGIKTVLDCVAKHEATRLIRDILAGMRGVRQELRRNPGRHWLQLCKDLQMK